MRPTISTFQTALAVAASVLTVAAPLAFAQTPARNDDRAAPQIAQIARLYRAADAAYDLYDADAQLLLLAPDCVLTDENGHTVTRAQLAPALRRQYAQHRAMTDVRTYTKTTPTHIEIRGDNAVVTWRGHQEAISRRQYAVADVQDESTGRDEWVRTPAGWRLRRQRRLTFHRTARGGITPEAVLALQQVHQSRALLDQVIAGEQASDDQQQQLRIEQNQYDEQVRRRRHGE